MRFPLLPLLLLALSASALAQPHPDAVAAMAGRNGRARRCRARRRRTPPAGGRRHGLAARQFARAYDLPDYADLPVNAGATE